MDCYILMILMILHLSVTKTVYGHVSSGGSQDNTNSVDSSTNTMLFKFLLETLVRDSSDLYNKIDKVQEKYHEQNDKIELETTLHDQNDEIMELKGNLVSSEKVIGEQNEKIFELETTLGEQNDEIFKLKENLKSNEKLIEEQTDDISELKLTVSDQNNEISNLKAKLASYEQDGVGSKETWHEQYLEMERQLNDLEETCHEKSDELTSKVSEIEATLQSHGEMDQQKFSAQTNEIAEVEEKVKTMEQSIRNNLTDLETKFNTYASSDNMVWFSVQLKQSYNNTLYTLKTVKFDSVRLNEGRGYNKETGVFTVPRGGIYVFLSYDVAVIQWLTSCHKNRMTTRYITLGYWHVTS